MAAAGLFRKTYHNFAMMWKFTVVASSCMLGSRVAVT
jgi:hypothetical protein